MAEQKETFTFTTKWHEEPIKGYLVTNTYKNNNNLYIGLCGKAGDDEWFEPWADLSTNIRKLPDNQIAVDANNFKDGIDIIEDQKLGEFAGFYLKSGYCEYPVYTINMERLKELCL